MDCCAACQHSYSANCAAGSVRCVVGVCHLRPCLIIRQEEGQIITLVNTASTRHDIAHQHTQRRHKIISVVGSQIVTGLQLTLDTQYALLYLLYVPKNSFKSQR